MFFFLRPNFNLLEGWSARKWHFHQETICEKYEFHVFKAARSVDKNFNFWPISARDKIPTFLWNSSWFYCNRISFFQFVMSLTAKVQKIHSNFTTPSGSRYIAYYKEDISRIIVRYKYESSRRRIEAYRGVMWNLSNIDFWDFSKKTMFWPNFLGYIHRHPREQISPDPSHAQWDHA